MELTANSEANPASSAAIIYAFDVIVRGGSPFLANKRVFAYAVTGSPSGMICDKKGNLYAACAGGVEVWNPAGSILGVIKVPGELYHIHGKQACVRSAVPDQATRSRDESFIWARI